MRVDANKLLNQKTAFIVIYGIEMKKQEIIPVM
jgi:hypothetical protein